MLKAILFDLDGVICSTDEYHYQAWKDMASTLGIYFDRTINNRLRGVSRMASLEIILERYEGPSLSEERKRELAERKNDTYRRLLANMNNTERSMDMLIKSLKQTSTNEEFLMRTAKKAQTSAGKSDGNFEF